jgi:hypothetical protein
MFRPFMRFTPRLGDPEGTALILGKMFENSPLKPGYVYEAVEMLGELMIREVGPCGIEPSIGPLSSSCWGHSANQIIERVIIC